MSRLTPRQQQMVEDIIGWVCKVSYQVWRRSCLPARCWPDLRADGLLEACRCARRYVPDDRWPFRDVAAFQVRKYLWKRVRHYRGAEPLGDLAELAREDDGDDGRVDELLRLLPCLPERQRLVLEMRYGLAGEPVQPHRVVCERLGIPGGNAKGYERLALDKLRRLARGGLNTEGLDVEEVRRRLSSRARRDYTANKERRDAAGRPPDS